MNAWFELLNGNHTLPVFREDVPASVEGDYILLRVESDTDTGNNHKFISSPVIVTEIVTKFKTIIDDSKAGDYDEQICGLLYSSPRQHRLPAQPGIQITSVQRRDSTYLSEDDGVNRIRRLITRNVHRVEQL